MKRLFYRIYALLFNMSAALFPVKNKRAAFVSMHNENFKDSLGAVMEEFRRRGFECVEITRRDLDIAIRNVPRVFSFFFQKSRLLATSRYVFLNDNFLPMAMLNFKPDAIVTQLWHAEGAFKRFGLAIEQPGQLRQDEIAANRKLSFVVCSSEAVVPVYAEAFGVEEERVLPLGAPRTDFLLKEENKEKAQKSLEKAYPALRGKKLVLYAPTFRGTKEENETLLSHFDFELFRRECGEDYALLVRLHPQVHEKSDIPQFVFDVTDYSDVRELVLSCEALITDYSSICMDFSLLSKKTVFFAYDKEKYAKERSFYFDYDTKLPGGIAQTTAEVIRLLREPFDAERNNRFKKLNFDFCDCENAKRVADGIIGRS